MATRGGTTPDVMHSALGLAPRPTRIECITRRENAMTFTPTPNGVKVCLRFLKAGQQVCNVFHVDAGATVTSTILNSIGAAFATWAISSYVPLMSNDIQLEAVEVTDISESGGLGIEYTTGLPVSGSAGLNPMPNNDTVAAKLTTGRTGRSYRGRTFWNGLPEQALSADRQHLTTAYHDQMVVAIRELITSLVALGFKLAVLSLFANKLPRASGVMTEIVDTTVNTTLDSQRRRLPERGS